MANIDAPWLDFVSVAGRRSLHKSSSGMLLKVSLSIVNGTDSKAGEALDAGQKLAPPQARSRWVIWLMGVLGSTGARVL